MRGRVGVQGSGGLGEQHFLKKKAPCQVSMECAFNTNNVEKEQGMRAIRGEKGRVHAKKKGSVLASAEGSAVHGPHLSLGERK